MSAPFEISLQSCVQRSADAARAVRARLTDPDAWLGLVEHLPAGGLTVTPGGECPVPLVSATNTTALLEAQSMLDQVGYCGVTEFLDQQTCDTLADGCRAVMQMGWHPAFLLMFDQPWLVARHVGRLMQAVANENIALRYEMFIYCVDATIPAARPRGLAAHRDSFDCGFDAHHHRAAPRHCTTWLALTDTDEDNGCIYLIPSDRETEAERLLAIDESRAIAVPAKAGTALMWGGHVAHWGGVHNPARAKGPRIAFTCVGSVPPIWGLPPLDLPTEPESRVVPPLDVRLEYIGALLRGFGRLGDESPLAHLMNAVCQGTAK